MLQMRKFEADVSNDDEFSKDFYPKIILTSSCGKNKMCLKRINLFTAGWENVVRSDSLVIRGKFRQ